MYKLNNNYSEDEKNYFKLLLSFRQDEMLERTTLKRLRRRIQIERKEREQEEELAREELQVRLKKEEEIRTEKLAQELLRRRNEEIRQRAKQDSESCIKKGFTDIETGEAQSKPKEKEAEVECEGTKLHEIQNGDLLEE